MARKKGFTLAEVLITLTVIGVIAALTIPQLVKNMNDYAFTKSKDVTLAKITEATNQMKSNDDLAGYTTNDAFVAEFQKYMKITKICDSTTLVNCFPAKFKAGTEDIDTTTLITGTKLGASNIADNTIAMMLANGTSILFTLRDSTKVAGACDRIDPTDNQANTTGCLSFLYDINGRGAPNVIGKDIGTVNATISTCDGKIIGGLCVDAVDLIAGTSYFYLGSTAEYQSMLDSGLIPHFFNNDINLYSVDYWAGAVKACNAKGMRISTKAELAILYDNYKNGGNTLVLSAANYSSSTPVSASSVWYQDFNNGAQGTSGKGGSLRVRCVK